MSVYLDYAATTPIDKDIFNEILMNKNIFGNPSSIHSKGKQAKKYLEDSRTKVANAIGAKPNEIIFTSGATESNNLAIHGVLDYFQNKNVITTKIEHMSILETLENLQNIDVKFLPVSHEGHVSVDDVVKQIDEDTKLITMHYVNNETGVIEPIKEISQAVKEKDMLFHVDAAQAVGHVNIKVDDIGVDIMSISGHKLNAPKGVGVLYVRSGTKIHSQLTGGKQELGRRAGTENLLFNHAVALAIENAIEMYETRNNKLNRVKTMFINRLIENNIAFEINGDVKRSSEHIVNIYLPWSESEFLLTALDLEGIYVSGGSACNAGTLEASHVIKEMYDDKRASHSIRVSFSHLTSDEDITSAIKAFKKLYERLK